MNVRQQGFTLVELMIVVVIIGILAAIAVPGYSSYRIKSSRAAAQTELLQLASLQEKIYLNSNAYTSDLTALGSSEKTKDGRYNLSLIEQVGCVLNCQTFEIRAVPVAGTAQAGDGCLLIKHDGTRQWHEGKDSCDHSSPKTW